jgi:DNA-3-methyladenine glycosylase I
MARCGWVDERDPLYVHYHDTEWGVPLRDERALWELLSLEGFQAGLSWITVLRKRAAFRAAFAGFEPSHVARFGEADVARLMADPGIVRARAKIEATIAGARIVETMRAADLSLTDVVWETVEGKPVQNAWRHYRDAPTSTPQSERLSKRLKGLGFKFCGPVITYAFMQAAGLVNDHEVGCPCHAPVAALG